MANKIEYKEIVKAKVSDARNIVISECSKGGFTIAQQLEAREGDKTTTVFMKNAFHVDEIYGLQNLRDALNAALYYLLEEDKKSDSEEWDEE